MYRVLQSMLFSSCFAAGGWAADKSGYTLFRPVPAELLRDLSTDRPDQTESPYTVDAGHFQLEMDFVTLAVDRDTTSGADARTRDVRVAPVNLKVGLTNRMDFQLMIDPHVSSRFDDRRTGVVERASGFGDVTARLKFNFWGNDAGSTAFGVMPFVKLPLSASDVRNGETEGGIIAAFSFSLPRDWSSTVMTEVDWVADGVGDYDREWVNSITFSHDITERLGGYLEFFTVVGDAPGFRWQGQFDVGLTYAWSKNIQFDVGCNFGVTRSAPDYSPFVGFSRRF